MMLTLIVPATVEPVKEIVGRKAVQGMELGRYMRSSAQIGDEIGRYLNVTWLVRLLVIACAASVPRARRPAPCRGRFRLPGGPVAAPSPPDPATPGPGGRRCRAAGRAASTTATRSRRRRCPCAARPIATAATDPAGFDCSGFVQYVFDQHGIAVPRDVRRQFEAGSESTPDALEPGDSCSSRPSRRGASHVGIAVGGDQFVHAPSTSGVVRVEHLSAPVLGRSVRGRASG